jgi:hypothetical protein
VAGEGRSLSAVWRWGAGQAGEVINKIEGYDCENRQVRAAGHPEVAEGARDGVAGF